MSIILDGTSGITSSGSITTQSSSGVIFSDSSNQGAAASPYVLKNRIINGAMEIDQRNNGAAVNLTSTTGIYTVDRWFGYSNSTASGTLTAQQISTGYPYTLRVARTSGTYTGGLTVGQVIESKNMLDLAGQTVTLSFKLAKGSSYNGSTIQVFIWSGTVADQGMSGIFNGNWTGIAQTNTTITPTTTATTYTLSYAVPANAKELAISFVVNSFTGTGSANDYFEISNVQLEVGSTATPFERRLYNQELANCQRYYQQIGFANAIGDASTTSVRVICPLFVPLRAQPSVSANAALNINLPGTSNTAQSSANATYDDGNGSFGISVNCGNFTGITGGKYYLLYQNTVTTRYIALSAEL